jgi:hypothetical protein
MGGVWYDGSAVTESEPRSGSDRVQSRDNWLGKESGSYDLDGRATEPGRYRSSVL